MSLSINCVCNLPDLIPRELLFSDPVKCDPRISPGGKKLAYLALENNVMNLWIKSVDRDDDRPVTDFKKGCVIYYIWTSDKYIFYIYDMDGNETHNLYKLNTENNESKPLKVSKKLRFINFDYHKDFPDQVIAAMAINNKAHLYHIDLASDNITLLYENPGNIYDWLVDNKRNVIGIILVNDDNHMEFIVRHGGRDEWKSLVRWNINDMAMSRYIRCSKDNNYIYMIDGHNCNTSRLIKVEISTGKSDVIICDPEYDINPCLKGPQLNKSYLDEFYPVLFNPDTWTVQAVSINKFRNEWIILDDTIKEDFTAIQKLKDGDFFITSRDRADEKWVLSFNTDKGPVSYYLFDRTLKKETFLFYDRPALNDYTFASMEELSFTSRDGLTVHCYISFPPCVTRKKLPVVLFVHGGPWYRDKWGYDPTVQWIANRGYVCLQVNYRGSTGYGKDFLNAGNKEWGGKMQEDLEDAVRWIIEKGIADPARVAIYGHGYGGFAAMAGATFTPDLFCCAIAVGCFGDLTTVIQAIPSYREDAVKQMLERVGDPESDRDLLLARSPFYKLDNIKIPLMIAYGLKSRTVKSSEPYRIVSTLKTKGITAEHIVFPDEGHKIVKKKNRIKLYAVAERFLAKHLKGRYEAGDMHVKDIYIAASKDNNLDDRRVINKIVREGDTDAFEHMMDYYKKPVLKHLYNMTGDYETSMELLQETFLKVWLYLDSYSFVEGISFSSWLFKIASNVAITYGTKKYKFNGETEMNEMDFADNWTADVEDKVLIQSLVNSLEEPFKTAIMLRYIEELDYKNIASVMNTNLTQVKNYLFRAKKSILQSFMNVNESF
ncbi:MAG: alpha/beta fold hydrolase [Candidatus Eremiobacterota bacterium]